MKLLFLTFLLLLLWSNSVFGQSLQTALGEVQHIKLLTSTREEVRKALIAYSTSYDDDDYDQRFSNDSVDIRVTYATGNCGEEAEYSDHEDLWKVNEWVVTRIEIEPDKPIAIDQIGFDLSRFAKQLRFKDDSDSVVYHNKKNGVAFLTDEDGVFRIILFPRVGQAKLLCGNNSSISKFYSTNAWYPDSEFEPSSCTYVNQIANVTDVTLDRWEISGTTSKLITVSTSAVDPENDPLTYDYSVTGGKIIGRGAKVVWDLTGVPPGTYKITVGVDDGGGLNGNIITKSVVVK